MQISDRKLTSPVPKKRVRVEYRSPFPVPVASFTGRPASAANWRYFVGQLVDTHVLIDKPFMEDIYSMGFFGKGTLSRHEPNFEENFWAERKNSKHKSASKESPQKVTSRRKYLRHLAWRKQQAVQNFEIPEDAFSESEELVDIGTVNESPDEEDREPSQGSDKRRKIHDAKHVSDQLHEPLGSPRNKNNDWSSPNDQEYDLTGNKESDWPGPSKKVSDWTDVSNKEGDWPSCAEGVDPWSNESVEESERFWGAAEESKDHEVLLGNSVCAHKSGDVEHDTDGIQTGSVSRELDPHCLSDDETGDLYVVDDTDDSEDDVSMEARLEWHPVRKCDPFKLHESLQLTLEEAFFLSYALGCLVVFDESQEPMDLLRMWQTFSSRNKSFIPNYVTYHNFRSKGWVPKPGLNFGASYVLYKKGPPFYHASYAAMVKMVKEKTLQADPYFEDSSGETWPGLCGLDRVVEKVAKELMLCYVIQPDGMSHEDMRSPECVSRFRIQEVVMKRWVAKADREKKS